MVFRDTLQLFFSSLEALASSLARSGRETFKHLQQVIGERNPNAPVELVERKGVFCYDYFDSIKRFEDQALPFRPEQFYSRPNNA